MASNNFFARLANLWSGFVSLWISDVEKNHPEIAYENAINSMIEKYSKLKSATAAVIRRRDEIKDRMSEETAKLEQIVRDLDAAVSTGQDDLALVLIQRKTAAQTEIASLQGDAKQAEADADDAKNSLTSVKSEIAKLKSEKDRMLAKMNSAQARLMIQEKLDGLSVDAEVQALDKVREHIKNTVASAKLGNELNESDLDVRLKNLTKQAGSASAQKELEDLKRARAAQAAGTAKQM